MELLLSADDSFVVGDTDMAEFRNRPVQISGGAVLFCTAGRAVLSVGVQEYDVSSDTEMLLLPDSVFTLLDADADFRVILFTFSRQLFEEAGHRLDPAFFRYLKSYPIYRHTEQTGGIVRNLFGVILSAYNDAENIFRTEIVRNHLRNILLNVCDKVRRNYVRRQQEGGSRKEELFHRFVELVSTHFTRQRDVAFYADELCISMSYLASVTRVTTGETPKQTIDKRIVQEIKILLAFSDLSLQQIADRLNFPDQSYLGRFFKHHTGRSPIAYRNGR